MRKKPFYHWRSHAAVPWLDCPADQHVGIKRQCHELLRCFSFMVLSQVTSRHISIQPDAVDRSYSQPQPSFSDFGRVATSSTHLLLTVHRTSEFALSPWRGFLAEQLPWHSGPCGSWNQPPNCRMPCACHGPCILHAQQESCARRTVTFRAGRIAFRSR